MHATVLSMLADRYGQLENLTKQSELLLAAADLARSAHDAAGEAQKRCITAWVMFRSSRSDSAELQLARALPLIPSEKTAESRAAVVACNSALAYRYLGRRQLDSAITHMKASVTLLQETGDTLFSNYDVLLNNYGEMLMQVGRTREALAQIVHLRALLQVKGETETDGYVTTAANTAVVLLSLGEFASARSLLESEIARVHQPGSTAKVPLFFRVRAMMTYRRLEMADSAYRLATELAADTEQVFPPWLILDVQMCIADALLRTGQVAKARAVAAASRPIQAKVGNGRPLIQAVLVDAALESAQRGPTAALDTLRRFIASAGTVSGTPQGSWLAPALAQASAYALAAGDVAVARTLANDALAAATIDTLALTRSAYVGEALAAAAHAAHAAGDTRGARQLATRALVPLRFGFGETSAQVTAIMPLLAPADRIVPARSAPAGAAPTRR